MRKGPSPKSLDSEENCKPQYTLFCRNIKIRRGLCTFWKTLAKKRAILGVKTVFLGQEVHYYMDKGIAHEVTWSILATASGYNTTTKQCRL